jgi:hypothetical protein
MRSAVYYSSPPELLNPKLLNSKQDMNDFLSFAVSSGMNSAHLEHAMASSMQSFNPTARGGGFVV